MNKRIYLSPPHMGGKELEFIHQAFDSNWIAPYGPNINGFEQDICKYTGSKHCAVLNSGTAAIHLSLILLGVQTGDEILTSTFTFSATVNPILYQGASPIFIESEADTWNMSPDFLEEAIVSRLKAGKKPKAILLVHLYGMPAKLKEILAIAIKYDIPLIEDAAEALGSTYKGKALGTFGDIGIYSFNGNKIITTSGGGALISNKKEYVDKAVHLATQSKDNAIHYEHSTVGYNYRMSNVSAGIGRGQMLVLNDWISRRRSINALYKQKLSDIDSIEFLNEPSEDYYSNFWLTTILINSPDAVRTKEDLRIKLETHNIESRPLWKPMHLQPVFREFHYYGNGLSESLFNTGLCLPSGSSLTNNQLKRITTMIRSHFK